MLRGLRWRIHTLEVFYSLKKSNIGVQYEIRKLKNPIQTLQVLIVKNQNTKITYDIIYFASLTVSQKPPLSSYACSCYLLLISTYLTGMPYARPANQKSQCKINYPQIFVSCFDAGLSCNCGNHVYSTFLPACINLVWCLLHVRKSAPLEDNCLLRYFLMLQSSRNGYTFYSATGFEQQAFYTCPQRIQNSSIWEKSNLIPILAQPLNPLLYFYRS